MLIHSKIFILSLFTSIFLSSIYLVSKCIKISFNVQFFRPDYLNILYFNLLFFIVIISSIYSFVIFCKRRRDKIILKNRKKFHNDYS